MARATLTIDLDAITANWRALDLLSGPGPRTAAVLKADAYGLGAAPIGTALARAGVTDFFVALAEEGARLRAAIGPERQIFILSGYLKADRQLVVDHGLIPVLCSPVQLQALAADLPGHPCGLQIDNGMNRLGFKPDDLALAISALPGLNLRLVLGHLACSDEPGSPVNARQLAAFRAMSASFAGVPRSLSATGGITLGSDYHFDLARPGIGLFGGLPFAAAKPVVTLVAPVLQVRDIRPGETVGYGASFTAAGPMRLATIAAGYADGLRRALAPGATMFAGAIPCPVVGRISMDLITLDVTHLRAVPDQIEVLGPHQTIDQLAAAAGTIGYEILTGLGARLDRRYTGG
jgi:alanine racemase